MFGFIGCQKEESRIKIGYAQMQYLFCDCILIADIEVDQTQSWYGLLTCYLHEYLYACTMYCIGRNRIEQLQPFLLKLRRQNIKEVNKCFFNVSEQICTFNYVIPRCICISKLIKAILRCSCQSTIYFLIYLCKTLLTSLIYRYVLYVCVVFSQ